MTAPDPLDYPCPRCHAGRGARCATPDGRYVPPHNARRRAARNGWEQLTFDLYGGEAAKADGMGHALGGAPSWHHAAMQWVRAIPAGRMFTSEDVVAAIGLPRGKRGTNNNNAVGATMNALRRADLIRGSGRMVRSRRPSSHAALIAVWTRTEREHEQTHEGSTRG